MLTENACVGAGLANGTRARVEKVLLKAGESATPLHIGRGQRVNTVYASQVSAIHLRHVDTSITPQQFSVEPTQHSFTTTFPTFTGPRKAKMQGRQFPFVSNTCTTGHKLQGATVDDILVTDWVYEKNWHYVVLSRVRTMEGMHMRKPLSEDLSLYAKPPALTEMMNEFRGRCLCSLLPDADYEQMMV